MNDSITKYIYAYVRRRPALCAASVYMARYGYWLYLLFGIVEWLRPGTDEIKRKARMALLEAIFSVCYSSLFSCFIGRLGSVNGLLWRIRTYAHPFFIRIIRLFRAITP